MEEHELLKLRLDYAWKYFESAARQRMLFINYFLIAVGVLANAYGLALREELYPVAAYVCVFGMLASFAFMVLDHRMLSFVLRALDVLETLERQSIFQDGFFHVTANNEATTQQLGLARIQPDQETTSTRGFPVKVKFWVRCALQGSAAAGFLLGLIYAIRLWYFQNP